MFEYVQANWMIAVGAGAAVFVVVIFAVALAGGARKKPQPETPLKEPIRNSLSSTAGAHVPGPDVRPAPTPAPSRQFVPINDNADFVEFSEDSGLPANWRMWREGVVRRSNGPDADTGIDLTGGEAGKPAGLEQRTGEGLPMLAPGSYVLAVEVTLRDGGLKGGGVIFNQFRDPAFKDAISSHKLSFARDIDVSGSVAGEGEVGRTYQFQMPVEVSGPEQVYSRLILHGRQDGLMKVNRAALFTVGAA